MRIVSETSGTISNVPTFEFKGAPEDVEKKKGYEKNFEEIIVENFPNMEKEIIKSKKQSPIQGKPKEKHTKTHTNQTNKD